ncbi:hypothetical protein [Xanthocytophaga agilis]|uniref:DUF8173 domain-containing protein n=1 Tax=Xanthocytophaga agilis TaxID=3048010 RepID=A0AAE3RAW2_9BACT|nr:hypothetical protein [Xanthocytophaga agilis]MDJ1506450.1 hypothetical protein [Xanthocytophaga agilis]
MKKLLLSWLCVIVICQGYAMHIKYGDTITINQPVYEDVYVAAGTVVINAPIHGDLIAGGGTITINDTIDNDILSAGGTIIFNGYVGDDIRCMGGRLHLLKSVAGDVVLSGGKLLINKGVIVGGSLLMSGGSATISGTVRQNIQAAFDSFVFNGLVGKNVDFRGNKLQINGLINGKSILAANQIELGPNARFYGDVSYWNPDEKLDFKHTLKNAKAAFDPSLQVDTGRWHYLGFASSLAVLWYLGAALVLIVLAEYLFDRTFRQAATLVVDQAGKSIGYGLLFFVAVPVSIALFFATLIGIPLGIIVLMAYLTVLVLSHVITSLVASQWLNRQYGLGSWKKSKLIMASLGIFILLKVILSIPFLGWLVNLVIVCQAFGSIVLAGNKKKKMVDTPAIITSMAGL